MIFVKVLDLVTVIAGLVGLVLSFTAALYWQHHFNFNELTAMHVAGVFVMLVSSGSCVHAPTVALISFAKLIAMH